MPEDKDEDRDLEVRPGVWYRAHRQMSESEEMALYRAYQPRAIARDHRPAKPVPEAKTPETEED